MSKLILTYLFLLFTLSINAQTPPARTWYYNDYGAKTTVKERWEENSQGQKHGTYIKYFTDGEREILGYFKNDKPNGQFEITIYAYYYFQKVKTITYANFVNGLQNGLYKTVSGDVTLVEGNYSNDIKTGYWKDNYDIELKIYEEGQYVNGKRDGEWKNTYVAYKSKDELGFGVLTGDASLQKTEIKKGYKTVYKNGEVLAVYDDKGVNVFEKQKLEEALKLETEEFESCESISDYENFRIKYPYSEFDSQALIKISELKKEAEIKALNQKKREEEEAYLDPLIDKWAVLNDKASVVDTYWAEYFLKFPDGIYKSDIQNLIEKVKNNIKATQQICDCDFNKLNNLNSDKGSVELTYAVAMEIKQKYGLNIYRYLNYTKKFNNSFLFIEEYPNLDNDIDIEVLKQYKSHQILDYQIKNGTLSSITISYRDKEISRKFTFTFYGNNIVETFTFHYKDLVKYESFKQVLKFDSTGKLLNGNEIENIYLEMFK